MEARRGNSKGLVGSIPTISSMILAGTGHRPNKILIGDRNAYDTEVMHELTKLARRCLKKLKPDAVISGMALGWDQALARAALWEGIVFDAYVPFVDQEGRWPYAARVGYQEMLKAARHIVVCSDPGYHPGKMQVRNERMVNDAQLMLALWNGTAGGTANCVRYAKAKGVIIHNVWDAWVKQAGRVHDWSSSTVRE